MKTAHLAIAALVLVPVLYVLWRVDVLPGLWDLQHWGKSPSEVAQEERAAYRAGRLAQFKDAETLYRINERLDRHAALDLPGPVVFLGSSTLERFDAEAAFPGAWVLNRGIGDETADLLAARLELSLPAEAWSRAGGFVLYVASPDFRRLDVTAEQLERRTARVLDILDGLAPGPPRLLLGLLPERNLDSERRAVLEEANARLASLADARPEVTFLPTDRVPLRDAEGQLSATHAEDDLHLNDLGYQVLGRWIRLEGGPVSTLLAP